MVSTRARLRFTGRAEVYNEGRSPAKPFSANGETLLSRLFHYRGPPQFSAEKIIIKLREAEVGLAQGQTVGQVCKQIGVTEQTYYRWRKEYGGLRLNQAKRLKVLEKENARLKKLVADLSLDKQILKEVSSGNF